MSRPLVPAKIFRSFADLAAAYDEGADYLITRVRRPSSTVSIVASHGGRIEAHTSVIAIAAFQESSLQTRESSWPRYAKCCCYVRLVERTPDCQPPV